MTPLNQNATPSTPEAKGPILANLKWIEEFDGLGASEDIELKPTPIGENFSELFEQAQKDSEIQEGAVIEGKIVARGEEYVTIDIGFKCEGLVPLHEFIDSTGSPQLTIGDTLSVYVERLDIEHGAIYLSKDRADIIKAWDEISEACESDQLVDGIVIAKVKGGLAVDIGVKAFLPGSQLDTKPIKSLDRFIGQRMKFKILKFNKKRGNIVLSRRAVLAHEREQQRAETLAQMQEGMVVVGNVKNITDYGAFVDLGGMDGLLHITDMSWGRIKHPSEVINVGDEIKVKILKYDREKQRVSLGLKQVSPNPWDEAEFKFPVGKVVKGKIVSVKDYGAFVELDDGIEGLIHVSEMSWTERVKNPAKFVKVGDETECKVLEVDTRNKRISLGIKQLQSNPWDELEIRFPVGSIIEEAEVRSITDFGIFVDVGLGIDGLIHVSDMSWTKKVTNPSEKYKKGDKVRAVVLSIDKASEKFSLGVKQLERDPWDNIKSRYRTGQSVDGVVTKIMDFGAFVELEEGVEGLIYISELSESRIEKPSDVVKSGDQVRAEILSIDPKERRISLSIKQLGRSEERANFENYMGDNRKKTSMGDAFGSALQSALDSKDPEKEDGDKA